MAQSDVRSVGYQVHVRSLKWCMYRWCRGSANGLRIRRKLINKAHLDAAPQAILVANHLSSLDILVLGSFLRRDYRWLAKSVLFRVPFSGWYLRIAGHIPVRRDLPTEERTRLIEQHIGNVVEEGASLLFFPEGTRSNDGDLHRFRIGAFMAAVQHMSHPVWSFGTHELMVPTRLSIRADRECSVTVLETPHRSPGLPSGTDKERAQALKSLCFDHFLYRIRVR